MSETVRPRRAVPVREVPMRLMLRWPVAVLIVLATNLASAGHADVLPLLNASSVASTSNAGTAVDTKIDLPPPGNAPWNGQVFSNASDSPYYAFGLMNATFSYSPSALRGYSA